MKYPFTPEVLDSMPEEIAELFRGLEDDLLTEICSRLKISGQLNEVTVQDIRALRSIGIPLETIEKAIRARSGVSVDQLDKLLDDVVARNRQYYEELIDVAQLTQPEYIVSKKDIEAIKAQTENELVNLTRSLGFMATRGGGKVMLPPAKAYQHALDRAEMQILSGGINYNEAIKTAVKELADSGIKAVDYESGHVDQIDVAVRRAVMTGIGQLCDKYTVQAAEYLGTSDFEISAHVGARDTGAGWQNHKAWQGKVYSEGQGRRYPDIYSVCGLGYVDGLEGANCRHKRFPWVEGVSERTYTDEQLKNIDPAPFSFQGKTYTMYEATQKQRQIERTVRKLTREENAYKAAGLSDDARDVSIRIRRLKTHYKEFSSFAGLPEQRERMMVAYNNAESETRAAALSLKRRAEAPIREALKTGAYNLTINQEKQSRHMQKTAISGRSVITIPAEELQEIINKTAGTGKILFKGNSFDFDSKEIVYAGKEIGYTESKINGVKVAKSLKIHYSKTGTHAVPYSGWWKK